MADYVEKATLQIVDKSSKPAQTINAALTSLFKTAKSLKSVSIKIGVSAPNLKPTLANVRALNQAVNALSRSGAIRIGVNASNVTRAQTAINKLRADAAKPIQIKVQGGSVPRIQPQGSPNVPPVPVIIPPSTWTPMRQILADFTANLVSRLGDAIGRNLVEGTRAQDIANTRIRNLQLGPQGTAQITAVIDRIFSAQAGTPAGMVFNRAQIAGIAGELLPSVNYSFENLAAILPELTSLATKQIALGEDANSAIESMLKLSKAAEQSGNMLDSMGNLDMAKFQAFIRMLSANTNVLGREINPQAISQLAKYLRTSKFTLTPEGFSTALQLFEELGTTAAVGINQLIKQLSGNGVTKRALAAQKEAGLTTTQEIVTGTVGGKKSTAVVGTSVNERLLRQDPARFVREYILPAMRAAGMDPNDPVAASTFANKVVSDRTAVDALTALIVRSQELQNTNERIQKQMTDRATTDASNAQSALVALTATATQFQGVLGQVGDSFTFMLPIVRSINSGLGSISDWITGGAAANIGPNGEVQTTQGQSLRGAVVAAGAGGALIAGSAAGVGLLNALFNPLNGSAAALTASAASLQAAAASLSASGVGGAVAGGVAGGASAGKIAGNVAQTFKLGGKVGGAFGLVAAAAVAADQILNDGKVTDAIATSTKSFAEQYLPETLTEFLFKPMADKVREVDAMRLLDNMSKNLPPAAETTFKGPVPVANPLRASPAAADSFGPVPRGNARFSAAQLLAELQGGNPVLTTSDAGLNLGNDFLSKVQAEIFGVGEKFATAFNVASGPTFTERVAQLEAVARGIDQGAQTFGPVAGASIGQALVDIAPNIGNSIGSAAAALISAAVSNAQVTVRNEARPDTGTTQTDR